VTLRLGNHVLRGYSADAAFSRALAGARITSGGMIGQPPPESWGAVLRALQGRRPVEGSARPMTSLFEGSLPGLRATVHLVMDGTAPSSASLAARSAGSLLRRIHDLRADGLEERSVADTLAAAQRAGEVLRAVDPAVEARTARLLERLAGAAPRISREVISHGGFQAAELIRRSGDLAVLSVDDACRSAPARDLATYAADAATREDVDAVQVLEMLLEGYGARPEALRWHLSALLVRRAEHPFATLQEDWPARVEELVGAAERALD
jgi:hypothetical protein